MSLIVPPLAVVDEMSLMTPVVPLFPSWLLSSKLLALSTPNLNTNAAIYVFGFVACDDMCQDTTEDESWMRRLPSMTLWMTSELELGLSCRLAL